MSQRVNVLFPLVAMAMLLFAHSHASAQVSSRTAGISLRGATWGWPEGQQQLVWTGGEHYTSFDSEGVGGWISFVSRAADQVFVELSLGGLVRTVEEVQRPLGTETYVEALVPLLLGARVFPFEPDHSGALRPYVSLGAGPYWMLDILALETPEHDDVAVNSEYDFGGYLGVGVDFMISDWFGLNLDFRQHFVDFSNHHEYSGSEFALGVQFLWGDNEHHHRDGRRH